ncbi:hypothetical protein [Dyadobacter frigoris]|uniref:FecR domain-containing protein n=1 Tax=Dyadobacter frigoris TaxID=2576211 RepID=A0A4U6CQM2_9BACT|nr:hypothetical protein [Dyadobacter frigoris]TKT85945.1 hypothetical protein FDK13_33110 [Dyadobacter frigoris]GLU57150.1 hypothetical protein Dfri01_66110 [Dyadobacter frigoris]
MKVSKELIEKYHKGECTPEESAMVENWLLDDDTEIEIILPENLHKENVKAEMWQNISSSLPTSKEEKKFKFISLSGFNSIGLVAAASVLLLIALSFLILRIPKKESITTSVNTSLSENQEIDSKDYTISLGPESNARIDANTGLIDFCGTILISPKKDIDLSFKDICTNTKRNTGKMNFKKGETYIALNYRNKKDNELIVMDEKLLMGLPPIVKRQIMDQFNI